MTAQPQATLGQYAETYAKFKQERDLAFKAFEEQWKQKDELIEKLRLLVIKKMDMEGVTHCKTKFGELTKKMKRQPRPKEWQAFLEWAKTHDRLDLIQRRLVSTAILEMLDEGEPLPPGLDLYTEPELAFTKAKAPKA